MLTDEQFTALALGAGGADAIEALRLSRIDRHTLQLTAMTRLIPPGTMTDALRLLAAVEATEPKAVESVLGHPSIGAWAGRCLRRLRGTYADAVPLENDLNQVKAMAAAAAIRAGHDCEIAVPMRFGAIWLPTLGVAAFEDENPWGTARVSVTAGQAEVRCGDGMVSIPADPSQDGPGWLGLRRIRAAHLGLELEIDVEDIDPCREAHAHPLAPRLNAAELARLQACLQGAWEILTTEHPHRASELAAGLMSITPLQRAEEGAGASITGADAFGSFLATPSDDPVAFADTLVHEFQHSKLYAIMHLVDLHTAGPQASHYSPWRDDPRPLEGLLHAVYSYVGVTDYWDRQRRVFDGPRRAYAEFEFVRWSHQVRYGIEVLNRSDSLTPHGLRFTEGMAVTASGWAPGQGMALVNRLAALTIADHRLRWCLRNLIPDPVAVKRLAEAWQAGLPCPEDIRTIESTVRQGQRDLRLNPRLRLINLMLQQPSRYAMVCRSEASLSEISPSLGRADTTLLDSDPEAAYSLYLKRIQQRPDDIEQWAGLLLALDEMGTPFSAAPEVLLAVCRLVDRENEAERLLHWLQGDS